jgi:predicted permease
VHTRFGNLVEQIEKVRAHGSLVEPMTADGETVMPGLFATMEITLLEGRDFSWADDEHSPHVAIISTKLANKLFPGRDPIGLHLDVSFPEKEQDVEVIGIVSDASLYDIRKPAPPTIYLASTQYGDYTGYSELMVRTTGATAPVMDSVRATVNSLGHEYVPFVATVTQELDRSILQERITGILSGFLAVLALLLAAIGLYGLLAYHVTLRTREIGIRVALGAQRREIRAMILRETFRLLLLGAAIGLPLALGATKSITHMLFGVSTHDPATIATTIAALSAAGVLAAILPAWRAMRVDPIVALRCE